MTPITVVSDPPDNELRAIAEKVAGAVRVASLDALVPALAAMSPSDQITSLDLVGHTRRDKLMRLGTTVIDPDDPIVSETFAGLVRGGVLDRLGIRSIRLLGCESACLRGAEAVVGLAHRIGMRIQGSTVALMARHYDSTGFAARFEVLLIDDTRIGRRSALLDLHGGAPGHRRTQRMPSAK